MRYIKKTNLHIFAIAFAIVVTGCENEDAPKGESLDAKKQLLFSGNNTALGCNSTIEADDYRSMGTYSFQAKKGYTFLFNATSHDIAYLFILDGKTHEVLFDSGFVWSETGVALTPEEHTEYLIYVLGSHYTLSLECHLGNYCVEWETLDSSGTPLKNFYVQNVGSLEEAEQVLTSQDKVIHSAINSGSCEDQHDFCTKEYRPVCTDYPLQKTKYGNLCEFKVAVRNGAGDADQNKGHYGFDPDDCEPTMCGGIAGFLCPDGYKCIIKETYPDAAGSCVRVSCNYDNKEYVEGESFPAVDGCNKCTCQKDGVICSEIHCDTCNSKTEWWRSYRADSETCQRIRLSCEENTKYFSNSCGCGCEQSRDCPQTIDCEPPIDCSEEQARCPFSAAGL